MADPLDAYARTGTQVDGVAVLGALSPSRAADFKSCALKYRLRTVDRLPESPSPDALRGTVVHKVLEDLFDLPPLERTPERAEDRLPEVWAAVSAAEPEAAALFAGGAVLDLDAWLDSCRRVLRRYFELEDPRLLEPADRELYVETLLDSRLLLRGIIDRLDVAPDGAVRVVDYKGLALDTVLPTPTGWTTMRDVNVGDLVFGSDGRATRVTVKSAVHNRACFRVTFLDGTSVVCDNQHLWRVVTSRRQQQSVQTVDADALYQLHRGLVACGRPSSMWIASAEAADLPDVDNLPVSPWLVGAWLGDGSSDSGRITIGKSDAADMLALIKAHWTGGITAREERTALSAYLTRQPDKCTFGHSEFRDPTPGHPRRRCARESEHSSLRPCNLSLSTTLAQAGLRLNKHIPDAYLRAGTQQRIELLQGLMDTDGWWNKTRHRAGFTTTDDRLAQDVVELLRTLGIHPQHFAKPYANPVRPGRVWHVIEFTPRGFNPFSLPRKAMAAEHGVTHLQVSLSTRRIIAAVEPVPSVPTQCIAVDASDSLYVCGEGWIPTHNTSRSPAPEFETTALFQMRFYALVLWRARGVLPAMLRLIYLGDSTTISYSPDEDDLRALGRQLEALWQAVALAHETGEWLPRRGGHCSWCSFQHLCPEFGGTPPPWPVAGSAVVGRDLGDELAEPGQVHADQ